MDEYSIYPTLTHFDVCATALPEYEDQILDWLYENSLARVRVVEKSQDLKEASEEYSRSGKFKLVKGLGQTGIAYEHLTGPYENRYQKAIRDKQPFEIHGWLDYYSALRSLETLPSFFHSAGIYQQKLEFELNDRVYQQCRKHLMHHKNEDSRCDVCLGRHRWKYPPANLKTYVQGVAVKWFGVEFLHFVGW